MSSNALELGVLRLGTKFYAQLRMGKRVIRSEGPFRTHKDAEDATTGLERWVTNENWLGLLAEGKKR